MNTPQTEIDFQRLAACHEFRNAGIAIFPTTIDGNRIPLVKFGQYKTRRQTPHEIDLMFSRPCGVAVICGAISGGLEVLDFDYEAETIFPAWSAMVDDILIKLPVVETPSCKPIEPNDPPNRKTAGFHVFYRCSVVCKSKKEIATRDHKHPILIEALGEGHPVSSILSDPRVHKFNYEYIQVAGPVLPNVPTITPEERAELWKAARTFDRCGVVQDVIKKKQRQTEMSRRRDNLPKRDGLTPWDDFNQRGDIAELLTAHDWTSTDGIHWRHPNANNSISATVRKANSTGETVLRVFSSSTALEPDKSHSLFNVYAALNHGGNGTVAARSLKAKGYG